MRLYRAKLAMCYPLKVSAKWGWPYIAGFVTLVVKHLNG